MSIINSTSIYLACFAGVLIIFIPFMIMSNSFMKEKYKTLSSENTKAKIDFAGIGAIITFFMFVAIFIFFFVWADNNIIYQHRCFLNCDYCTDCYAEYYANYYADYYDGLDSYSYAYTPDCYSPDMCREFGCNYCVDYFWTDEFTRYSYAFAQWLYAIPRIMCVLFMTLSMIKTKHKYSIKSTKFIPAIILFAVSLILTSIFIEVWIAMLIFGICSIICFVLAIVFYILAIKKQCKATVNNAA